MHRIFVSSTQSDLKAYREAAVQVCNSLELHPVAMEHFEATGADAVAASRGKLDTCKLYVGIIAHRYGHVDATLDKSLVEVEYDHAVERGIEPLCFLADPEHPWPPSAVDLELHRRLRAFKERVERCHVRARFTTVEDFAQKLTTALVAWMRQHAVVRPERAAVRPPGGTLPPMPALVLGREGALSELSAKLVAENGDGPPVAIVRGWPGVGKTTLAAALVHDDAVGRAFDAGILWVSLGQRPNVSGRLAEWARAVGLDGELVSGMPAGELHRLLCARLRDERRLLVVDDVWEAGDAVPFRVGGRRSAQLFTTRLQSVAHELATTDDQVLSLPCFDEPVATRLLLMLAPRAVAQAPARTAELVRELEGLPLAIQVAGHLLRAEAAAGFSVERLLDDLREGAALLSSEAPSTAGDPAEGSRPTISVLLRKSTDLLSNELRDAFAYLGAFAPKPATFDLAAMARVWSVADARPAARALVARGLLEPIPETGRFQMHALLARHAASLLEDD